MENQVKTVEQAVMLLREHLETIRINLDILEVLKSGGRIQDTDKQYQEILELDRKNQQTFNKFVFTELPWFLEADQKPGNQGIKKTFLDWAEALHLNLSYLDRLIKEYMHGILVVDRSMQERFQDQEVKDTRFWKFLDRAKDKTKLFLSFNEQENGEDSDQPLDTEKSEGEQ